MQTIPTHPELKPNTFHEEIVKGRGASCHLSAGELSGLAIVQVVIVQGRLSVGELSWETLSGWELPRGNCLVMVCTADSLQCTRK